MGSVTGCRRRSIDGFGQRCGNVSRDRDGGIFTMALRIAIVGPGRVGMALAHSFAHAGANVLGYVGRDLHRTSERVAALGHGRVLDWADLKIAHVVVFAVGDGDLRAAVRTAAAAGGRRCSLWLHTSGRHELDVFEPAEPLGVRTGSLHPLMPFSANVLLPELSHEHLAGALAMLLGPPRSMRLLRRLCSLLGMQPVAVAGHQNRALYHAACAMAANGATSLFGQARNLLQHAGGITNEHADSIVSTLMRAAIQHSAGSGAGPALSGPVRRGDEATIVAHLDQLQQHGAESVPSYVALMQHALVLAREQGLDAAACERVAGVLAAAQPSS